MKKYLYILSILSVSGILFTGCYTQLTTRDRNYPDNGNQQTYDNDQGYSDQYQDSVYDDSSDYYGDNYYDSSGYDSNNYYDRGYNSPYYYDDFYYNYPTYSRYFWGYHPSIVVGFGWNTWGYDPFYCDYWDSWYYPGSWTCLPYYYYYPSPFLYGYNYSFGFGHPSFTHNFYTHRERTRDMTRLRNLDGLRGGRTGRGIVAGNYTGGVGRDITHTRGNSVLSTGTVTSNRLRKTGNGNTRVNSQRTGRERSSGLVPGTRGRTGPNVRTNQAPSIEKRNNGHRERRIINRNHYPIRKQYSPSGRENKSGNYSPRERRTSGNYNPPQRNSSPRSYSPPQRSYTPPQRSYNPPSHNSGGNNSGGGSRSGGGSSSGRGRR